MSIKLIFELEKEDKETRKKANEISNKIHELKKETFVKVLMSFEEFEDVVDLCKGSHNSSIGRDWKGFAERIDSQIRQKEAKA